MWHLKLGSESTCDINRHDLEVKEDEEHPTVCEGYEDLQGDTDLGNKVDLVEFFSIVMARMKENRWD